VSDARKTSAALGHEAFPSPVNNADNVFVGWRLASTMSKEELRSALLIEWDASHAGVSRFAAYPKNATKRVARVIELFPLAVK